jgi:hypothetical protein
MRWWLTRQPRLRERIGPIERSHAHGLSGDVSTVPGHSHAVSGGSTPAGSNAAHNNVQPTILNKIIFAGA